MSEEAILRVVPIRSTKGKPAQADWAPSSTQVVVGKDILELLSTSMYIDPMTIYREYLQNAADAIDEARGHGLLGPNERSQVAITIDPVARSVTIRDNGTGIASSQFQARLSNLGASAKRGTLARGFRGVGRLAGLGYCQELVFRSRADGEQLVSELRWDCRALKSALRAARHGQHLVALVQEIVSIRRVPAERQPAHFFEVELKGVIRHRNDRLLSPVAVGEYLAQVAPVPFSPDFTYGAEISAALHSHVALGELEIRINQAEEPIYRPYRNTIELGERNLDKVVELELKEVGGVDGGVAAIVWVLHHGYWGAIPTKALVKGIRLRKGNMQVGDHALLEELFPESRFNGWAVGEVHVIDEKILPNGRRDHFEQGTHFDNLLNQLTPVARDIARRCRHSSIERKWSRDFELHRTAALDKAKAIARGGVSRSVRQGYVDAIAKSLKAMRKVVVTRHIGEEMRADLQAQVSAIEARIGKLIGAGMSPREPLARFKPQIRSAYQRVIDLIYQCTTSSAAANSLVDKILTRLESLDGQTAKPHRPQPGKRGPGRTASRKRASHKK